MTTQLQPIYQNQIILTYQKILPANTNRIDHTDLKGLNIQQLENSENSKDEMKVLDSVLGESDKD